MTTNEPELEEAKVRKPGLAMRILKRILLAIVLIILFFVLMGLWTWKEQSDYESTAVPYLESVIPEITTWDPDIAWKHFDQDVRETISEEDSAKILKYLSKLGSLESLDRPQFREVTSSATLGEGARKRVLYQIPAVFQKGDATIYVTLTDRDGEFSIYHFKVDSMAFAETASLEKLDPPTDSGTP